MTGKNVVRIIVGLVIAAALFAVMFSYQVRHNERAIVETLGTLSETQVGPGLHWRLPYPIQKITRYDCRTQYFEGEYEQLQTADQRNVLVGVYVCWRIADPVKYRITLGSDMSRHGDLGKGEAALRPLVDNAKGNAVGNAMMESFASVTPGAFALAAVEDSILRQVRPEAAERFGIEVLRIGIERTSLPEDVTALVMENEQARRKRIAEQARGQGKADAAAIVSQAEAIRDQILAFAEQQASEIRSQGSARAAEYYKHYGENENFAMFLRRLEYLKKTLAVQTMFVLDGSGQAAYDDASHGWFAKPPTPESLSGPDKYHTADSAPKKKVNDRD